MNASVHIEKLNNKPYFEMILVKGGTFAMGSEEEEAMERERPVHQVALDNFYLGKNPVTQALWKVVMGEENNPARFKGDDRPVERISWHDTQEFIQKLNKITGKQYRLPTEAEWEYGARGGIQM